MTDQKDVLSQKKVRFFAYLRECIGRFGLYSEQSSLNARVALGVLLTWLTVFLDGMFLVCEADTFWDYTTSVFITLATAVTAIIFTMFISTKRKVFEILDLFDEICFR